MSPFPFRSMEPGIRCSVGKKGNGVEGGGTMARHRDEIHNDTTLISSRAGKIYRTV